MADNKKYYYLKLKDNFFESDEAIILESMPDGYIYSNILLKLYLRSLKNNGLLMFNDLIPYNAQMLATITRHHVGVIEKAMQIFQQLRLIEILDNGAIYMTNIQNFVGQSSTNADRMRESRRQLQMLNKCAPEIELEKEIELELQQEEKNAAAGVGKNIIFEKLKEAFGEMAISGTVTQEVEDLLKVHGQRLVLYALDETILNGGRSIRYTRSILERWQGQGLKTIEQVKQNKMEFEAMKQPRQDNPDNFPEVPF
ncbi:TPA: phage replisome organizer N-terminal domain-containing protein [Streptococcus suis]|uniref:phage replisome organizer N-terminal domain-containing protein n=1 Tax=Streptococcus suis TaxID=1307 RepID=UPI0009425376|nr:phage replisome organizer N-terminal domain-containing protein [Streptococcus suis]HEL1668637.1 phage replisome organizer N-terminal domain-containing protein [Streptococcus suis]HEL1727044.1 phage replisome organizer N-terminal domain-containing protein [Streptococcus suis]HEM2553267.1 phage replisome organizer N-terminal domain-containing protein [Streptococcus suis]HEM2586458.1 phage replisome organizer N-terminal domain-containing protein [Streptococcus suis]